MGQRDEVEEAALGAAAGGVAPLATDGGDTSLGDDEHNGLLPPGGDPEGMDAPPAGADQ